MAKSLLERFSAKYTIDPASGCWLWTAKWLSSGGYGWIGLGGRTDGRIAAHRAAYQLYVGPICEGLDLDHLCRNRRCVNPAHLEPVTRSENILRGANPALQRARVDAITHCPHGHEYTPENTLFQRPKSGRFHRRCRECNRIRKRK